MIDFCQAIINNHQWRSVKKNFLGDFPLQFLFFLSIQNSSYNNTRDILLDQIAQYDLDGDVKQLTKDDIQHIAISLLNQVENLLLEDFFIPSASV